MQSRDLLALSLVQAISSRLSQSVAILLAVVALAACTTTVLPPTETAPAKPVTVEVPVEVTVEVTRIVPQIVVEATPSPPQSCAPSDFEDTEEIVIGAILPLSPSGNMLGGFAVQAALGIAIDEVNSSGGIRGLPVRLVTYDSRGRADDIPGLVSRLVREDCAVAIVGILHDTVATAAAARANAQNIPLIIIGATTDEVPSHQYPMVYRIAPSATMLAEMPAKWLVEVGDYNGDDTLSAVNVVDSRRVASPEIDSLDAKFSEFGIEYQTIPVDLPASDFSSVIARIASIGYVPDAILISIGDESALEIEEQIRAANFGPQKGTLIVNNQAALDSVRFWQVNPDGIGTVVSRIGPWHKTVAAPGQTFALKYASYFGHWPEYYAFGGYDSIYLLADALERTNSPAGDDLAASIANTDTMLASGHYYFPYTSRPSADEAQQPEYMWNQWPDFHTLYLQYDESGQQSSDMPVIWPKKYRSTEGPLSWTPSSGD
ncbi:MAG: ABC transporter substrate-binding protein [Caldilineaceae bacterium]